MKKLMIALTAISSLALVAKAEIDTIPFEGFEREAFKSADNFVGDSDGKIRWATTDADASESVIQAYDASTEKYGEKYLHVDEGGILTRSLDSATAIPENGGSIEIDTRIQFTAMDPEATVEAGEGAKLAIWVKRESDEEGAKLNLMVTSGATTEEGWKAVDEVVEAEGLEINESEWYDLKVTSTADELGAVEFTIKIGEITLPKTFKSIVQSGPTKGTISSIGFKGQGNVDNIAFTANEGAELVDVTLEAEGVSLYDADGNDFNPESLIQVAVGTKIVAYAEGAAEEYEVTGAEIADDEAVGAAAITITAAKDLTVTISKKEAPVPTVVPVIDAPEGVVVTGVAESYKAGDKIVLADIVATPSASGKKTTVKLFVDDVEIKDAEYTVTGEEESIKIVVTEEDITYAVKINKADNTTVAQITSNDVVVATIATAKEGDVIAVTFAASSGYGFAKEETGIRTVTVEQADVTITGPDAFEMDDEVAVVVLPEEADAVITFWFDGGEVKSASEYGVITYYPSEFDGDKKMTINVVAQGYATYTEAYTKDDLSEGYIMITLEPAEDPIPPYVPAGKEEAYKEWAEGKDLSDVSITNQGKAFALNCDPADLEVAEANFKVTITMVDGVAKVSYTSKYGVNIAPVFKGAETVDGEYTEGTEGKNFFKAEIVIPTAK